MTRPLLVDLFCCAGGAAVGYYRAGFDVVGVDIDAQPNYPFEFHRADALTFPLDGFDAIHASPPCQAYSWAAARWDKDWPDLVAATRDRLVESGLPYVIENVVGAPLNHSIYLTGLMFGLKTVRRRHFESNVPLMSPVPHKKRGTVKERAYVTVAGHGGDGSGRLADWQEAMGIDWMTKPEMAQAIPPAYTEYIGQHLIRAVADKAAAL